MNATKEATHTPGPWTQDGDRVWDDRGLVAKVSGDTDAQAESNARLIAAAPDLLASLRELVSRCWLDTERHVYSLDSKGCGADVAALDAARSAIARATA